MKKWTADINWIPNWGYTYTWSSIEAINLTEIAVLSTNTGDGRWAADRCGESSVPDAQAAPSQSAALFQCRRRRASAAAVVGRPVADAAFPGAGPPSAARRRHRPRRSPRRLTPPEVRPELRPNFAPLQRQRWKKRVQTVLRPGGGTSPNFLWHPVIWTCLIRFDKPFHGKIDRGNGDFTLKNERWQPLGKKVQRCRLDKLGPTFNRRKQFSS